MNGIIYCATFTNGRVYVGQTIQSLETRKSQHKWQSENNKDNFIFHRAIRKYGFDNIVWDILEQDIDNLTTLNEREMFWIKEKNSYNKLNRNGCNMTPGGDSRENLFKYTKEDIDYMVERYKECGNSTIIGKEFNTTSSVIMNHVKLVLPDYKKYSYEGRGHVYLFNSVQKEEIYNYYITTGSSKMTKEKFNIKNRTFTRIMKSIDENYTAYEWHYGIPKNDVPAVIEEFKINGRLEPIAERYNIGTHAVRDAFKGYGFIDYTNFTKRRQGH